MQRDLNALARGQFDMLVVGGGIHGAWAALRAVQAGFRVALLEQDDFAGCTSANSLKILHGGLRYLQNLDFVRMRNSICARRAFARAYPHLFTPLPCVIPLRAAGMRSPWVLAPALLLNDAISFDRNADVERGARLPRGRILSGKRCAQELGPLTSERPVAGALWWDAVALDTARLTLEPLIAAATGGAALANHMRVESYLTQAGRVVGVAATDRISGRTCEIAAGVVINAAGPGAVGLSRAAGLSIDLLPRAWVGGMNIVLRRSLGLNAAVALSTTSAGGVTRELFFVPWRGVTMIGTHYVPLRSPAEAASGPPEDVIRQFLRTAAQLAPNAMLDRVDIAAVHWGALPLEAPGDRFPSKRPFLVSGEREGAADGLVTVVGEKLTSAPVLSERVLERAMAQLSGQGSRPAGRPHPGGSWLPTSELAGLGPDIVARLKARYGARWGEVARKGIAEPALLEPVVAQSAVLGVEVVHAVRDEMAMTLDDVLVRRLGLGDAVPPSAELVAACADVLARHCGWKSAQG
jgi:glycerol-3-phosphate dehydrogenase